MFIFSCFHVWDARENANCIHGDELPIDEIQVLAHAAVKRNVDELSLDVLLRDRRLPNKRRTRLMGRKLNSDRDLDVREFSESD